MDFKNLSIKYTFYLSGIFILSLGVTLIILSKLGTGPMDALLVGLSNKVGLDIACWEIIISFLLSLFNLILKKDKNDLLGLFTSIFTGLSINLWLFILSNFPEPQCIFMEYFYLLLGLIITGFGTAVYLTSNFAPAPIDNFMLLMKNLLKTNIFIAKTIVYILFLISSLLVSGPIGIGTLLTIALGGTILHFFMNLINNKLKSHN